MKTADIPIAGEQEKMFSPKEFLDSSLSTLSDMLEIGGVPVYTHGAHLSLRKRKYYFLQATFLDLISFHLFGKRYDQINQRSYRMM